MLKRYTLTPKGGATDGFSSMWRSVQYKPAVGGDFSLALIVFVVLRFGRLTPVGNK